MSLAIFFFFLEKIWDGVIPTDHIVPFSWAVINRQPHLQRACDILLRVIEEERPCGYVENIGREGTRAVTCTLKELRETQVNMFTTVFIGNAGTRIINGKSVTKRGYQIE